MSDIPLKDIQRLMRDGYKLATQGRAREALDPWFECWDLIKASLPTTPYDLEKEHLLFRGLPEPIYNWVTDVELELLNASMGDKSVARQMVTFLDETLELLGIDDHRENFLRSRALGLWRSGRKEEAETAMREMIARAPDNADNYITWADFHAGDEPQDLDRAREICRQALERKTLHEREAVLEALEALEPQEPGGQRMTPPAPDREEPRVSARDDVIALSDRASAPRPPVGQAVSQKIGRNDPCPCGSGKKYKKCCLP